MRIFLVGYMCSGKTTLGQALAKELGLPFVDLDDCVEANAGMCIKDIFSQRGEAAFRALEAEALRQACNGPDAVIACGGGTPCRPGAMDAMRVAGTAIYLKPNMERLAQRMLDGAAKRPLLAGIESIDGMAELAQRMLAQREPFYSQAHITFDSSLLETEQEIASSVARVMAILDESLPIT